MHLIFLDDCRYFSAWNVPGLGDKIEDISFTDKLQRDINILLETWKGDCKNTTLRGIAVFQK